MHTMRDLGTVSVSLAHTVPFKEEAPDSRVGLCVQTNTDFSISGSFVECSSALILKAEPALRRVSSCPLFPWMEVMDFAVWRNPSFWLHLLVKHLQCL